MMLLVYFNSPYMTSVVGGNTTGRDVLGWALDAGNSYGIEVGAWFEYGLMTSYGSLNNDFAIYASNHSWIVGQADNFYWLDARNYSVSYECPLCAGT
jgi:hypothetical protein